MHRYYLVEALQSKVFTFRRLNAAGYLLDVYG